MLDHILILKSIIGSLIEDNLREYKGLPRQKLISTEVVLCLIKSFQFGLTTTLHKSC